MRLVPLARVWTWLCNLSKHEHNFDNRAQLWFQKKKYDKNDSKFKISPPIGLKIIKSPPTKSHSLRAFQGLVPTSLKVLPSFHLIEFSMTKLFNIQKLLYHINTPWCTTTHQGYSKGTKSMARDTMHSLGDFNMTNKTKQNKTNKQSLLNS